MYIVMKYPRVLCNSAFSNLHYP